MSSATLSESGFLDKLKVEIVAPDSSTIASSNSVIDYVLISLCLIGCIKSLLVDSAVSWGHILGLISLCTTDPWKSRVESFVSLRPFL